MDRWLASRSIFAKGMGKKKTPKPMPVPQPAKRTSGVAPNFLWDKTSYVLGVTAGEGKRTAEEHAAFVARHRRRVARRRRRRLACVVAISGNLAAREFCSSRLARRNEGSERRLFARKRQAEKHPHSRSPGGAGAMGAARLGGRKERGRLPRHWRARADCAAASRNQRRVGHAIVRRFDCLIQSRRLRLLWPRTGR